MLVRASAVPAQKARGVTVVDHDQGVVSLCEVADRAEIGDRPVHREHAVCRDQPGFRVRRVPELRFQIRHVAMRVAEPPGLAKPDPVDDGCVIQRVADHRVFRSQQGLEQAAVGVEAR